MTATDTTSTTSRPPVIYLSHGAPPLADDRDVDRRAGSVVDRPAAAERDPGHLGPLGGGAAHRWVRPPRCRCVYDFWGFPQRYYEVTYDAPGAPELAGQVRKLLSSPQHPCTTHRAAGSTTVPTCRSGRDVPRGRRADAADLDADPGPATAVRDRPSAWRRCATRAC